MPLNIDGCGVFFPLTQNAFPRARHEPRAEENERSTVASDLEDRHLKKCTG